MTAPEPTPTHVGNPRRIRIVGISGSGKTRLGRQAAERLGLPFLELDDLFWDAGWQQRDRGDAHAMLDRYLAEHPGGWVADGNWNSSLAGRLGPSDGVDLTVWLDLPRWLVMWQVVTRTLKRGITRQQLWHGNRERPASWLSRDPGQNIVLWSWTQYDPTRKRYLPRVGEPDFLHLVSRRDVRAWLETLAGLGDA